MYMLFDEVPVPDSRYVVDRKRFQLLKNQVQSLQNHQVQLGRASCGCGLGSRVLMAKEGGRAMRFIYGLKVVH